MSLQLASNNTTPYAYYSVGTGSTPIKCKAILDSSGGTVTATSEQPVYLVATDWRYSGISLAFINEQTGINWQISTDGVSYGETISPADMDALTTDQTVQIYVRAIFNNDGSVDTGLYTAPDVQITAVENPE
jgi:hypothetical protein